MFQGICGDKILIFGNGLINLIHAFWNYCSWWFCFLQDHTALMCHSLQVRHSFKILHHWLQKQKTAKILSLIDFFLYTCFCHYTASITLHTLGYFPVETEIEHFCPIKPFLVFTFFFSQFFLSFSFFFFLTPFY